MKAIALSLTTASLLITGCATAKTERVYIGTGRDGGIHFADLDTQTGQLSTPQRAVDASGAGFITISPDKQFVYSTGVASYKINEDGTLTKISEQQTGEKGSCHVSTDLTGEMLMTAYYSSGSAASFQILEDGSLSEAVSINRHEGSGEHPKRQKKAFGHSVYPNPGNTHAYVADLGIDKVMIYKIDPKAGSMTPAGEAVVPGGAMGPRHMKFMPDGKTLYVLNELDLSVSTFQALENGQLKFASTVSTKPDGFDKEEMTAAEIRIHPNGQWVYSSNRDLTEKGRDSISIFTITPDGLSLHGTTSPELWFPRNFNIDPTGKWLIVGGQRSKEITVFRIDQKSGALTFTGQKIPVEFEPICFEFLN